MPSGWSGRSYPDPEQIGDLAPESFPPQNAITRENGGGGNRTHEPFPTDCPHVDHGEFTLCEAERARRAVEGHIVISVCGGKGPPNKDCPCRWCRAYFGAR